MRTSIKYKAAIFLALLLMLTLIISSYLVLQGIAQNQQQRYESLLYRDSQLANLYITQDYAKTVEISRETFFVHRAYELARQIGQMTGTHVMLYDLEGKEIGNSSPGLSGMEAEDIMPYALSGKISYQISQEDLYYLSPVIISNQQVGVIQLYYSLEEERHFYNTIRNLFFSIGSVIFFINFILGSLYFGRITNIIHSLKVAVDQIKQGDYHSVPQISRRDELGDLCQGIYYMSNQIEANIEDMKEEQHKLTLAVEKLRALEQQQRQFIGSVTHEFKTPLTVIKAYIDLLEMYPEDQKLVQDAKENIGKETQRLYEMVEKTLQLSALEKYEFELAMENIYADELLNEICSRMGGKIQKQGLQLIKEIERVRVYGDRESLFQVFINLIDNSIKYNRPNGKIIVRSYSKDDIAHIEIEDTGIGIPQDSLDKVFEPFYTVDKNRSRQSGGTGLGLALVKQLIEKQKGTISILRSSEAGTAFLIKLPHER